MLGRGFHWKWLKDSPPLLVPKFKNIHPQPDLDLEIQLLLLKAAIYEVPYQPCFISRIFLVPKSRGGNRLIIDLSSLDSHILAPYFLMHNHKSLVDTLHPPAWMSTIDLKDAYLHVPIRQCLHKYLAFSFGSKLYFFRALPFSLNVAPHIFTCILRWPLSLLHLQGINVIACLDDWVIWDTSHELTAKAVNTATSLLSNLGFLINIPKSHLPSSTDVEWLGIRWFPLLGRWALPEDKQMSIHKACSITKTSLTQAMGIFSWQTQLCHPNTTPQSTPATTTLVPQNSFKPLAPRRSEATASKLSQTPVTVATSQNVVNFPPFSTNQETRSTFGPMLPFQVGEVTLYLIRSHALGTRTSQPCT
ncbi:hypothetical protein Pcinc_007765 [Petrolisthes cinctipes]|uniref:Reverse transcriptase domain-containing protein n=1 Tax=Petrolisthes cinctipes TaxID=88211 RepID=A0AAE1G7U4_PETCI|nr:hypothetical protein Pcinc_007765 [Petrolisthes cinctipes]